MANRFDTTRWSVVVSAGGEGDEARDALAALCSTYRPTVLAYVRARIGNREEAEDLTQAFFAHLLERRLAARADRERGRFRSFLLVSLKHFLASEHERATALRRGGAAVVLAGSALDAIAASGESPEEAFEREWARTVLREALRRLGEEAAAAGRTELFVHLRPFLVETPEEGDYDAVAQAAGLRRNTVAVAVHRLRERLRELVCEVVSDAAGNVEDVETELRRMRSVLKPEPQAAK
jgi:RNA polymerase sigma factor (sigma-70 family)